MRLAKGQDMADRIIDLTHHWNSIRLELFAIRMREWIRPQWGTLLVLMLLQLVAYSYFYTMVAFSNHTFPNTWVYHYPSFKTIGEGRWLADLIILGQGGSGVQSVQMICATLLQAVNGILFAQFLGIQEKSTTLCTAALVCMYPAFLDYYSFTGDHLTFVLGDMLALLGVRAFGNCQTPTSRIGVASMCFLLALAAYQPKVALVSLLALGVVLLRCSGFLRSGHADSTVRRALLDAVSMTLAYMTALGLYWLTVQLVRTIDLGHRTYLNTPRETVDQIVASYPKTLSYFTIGTAGLPAMLSSLPMVGIVLGACVVLRESWRKSAVLGMMAMALLLLIPVALRAAYVINRTTWQDMGRIVAVNGYCLVFFLGLGLRHQRVRPLSALVSIVCLYFFTTLAIQESNAAIFKTAYDMNFMNRIAARVEMALGKEHESHPRALVVAGLYPQFDRTRYVRNPAPVMIAQIQTHAFMHYRQSEMLNFFIGRTALRHPTLAELERVVESLPGKPAWPSPDSVFLFGDVLVVILEPYRPDMSFTWTSDKVYRTSR